MTLYAPPKVSLDEVIRGARSDGRSTLLETEAKIILEALGIETPEQVFVDDHARSWQLAEEACARFHGEKVVVKIVAADVSHKSELGGVRVVPKRVSSIVATMIELRDALTDVDLRGFLISEFVEHGSSPACELLLGVRWTPDFGAVVTFGPGGVYTEFLAKSLAPGKEIAVLAAGLTPADSIDAVVAESFVGPMLTGALRRQKPLIPADRLRDLLVRFMAFATEHVPETILEMEINPLVPTGSGVVALDTLVKLGVKQPAAEPERPLLKIRNLLQPKSVAVMGVSKQMNPGRIIVQNLLREGFPKEKIFVIKPGEQEVDGCRCVPDIEWLPEPVDLLVLSISADQVPGAIDRVVSSRKAESVIVIPGGLGEHEGSEELEARTRQPIRASRATQWKGPIVNGPNCLGIKSAPGHYDTIFLPQYKLQPAEPIAPGADERIVAPVAIVSQSGAFAVSKLTKLGFDPRYVISIGNQVDLTVGDYLQYLEHDQSIEVFAFYVEGFRPLDGRRWLEAARRVVGQGRPVILYRAGRTAEGAKATASHTAAIASDAVVTRELARAAGVLVADTIEEFEDLVRVTALLRRRKLRGTRIAAMSNAGFESVSMADNLGGFTLAQFGEATRKGIESLLRESRLEEIVTLTNPLDVNPLFGDASFAECVRLILEDDGVDAGVVGAVPLTGSLNTLTLGDDHGEDILATGSIGSRLAALWERTTKPWLMVIDAGTRYDALAAMLQEAGVPVFRTADRALRLFDRWATWQMRFGK